MGYSYVKVSPESFLYVVFIPTVRTKNAHIDVNEMAQHKKKMNQEEDDQGRVHKVQKLIKEYSIGIEEARLANEYTKYDLEMLLHRHPPTGKTYITFVKTHKLKDIIDAFIDTFLQYEDELKEIKHDRENTRKVRPKTSVVRRPRIKIGDHMQNTYGSFGVFKGKVEGKDGQIWIQYVQDRLLSSDYISPVECVGEFTVDFNIPVGVLQSVPRREWIRMEDQTSTSITYTRRSVGD